MDKAMHSEFEGHTPGPWKVISMRPHGVMRDIYFISPNGRFEYNICEITNKLGVNTKANADLIAKAPDLLKENQSLRSELQKQKELNAELVKGLEKTEKAFQDSCNNYADWLPTQELIHAITLVESLIKKSKES